MIGIELVTYTTNYIEEDENKNCIGRKIYFFPCIIFTVFIFGDSFVIEYF